MGEATVLRRAISAVVHEMDWSDPAWGTLEGAGFSIEFSIERVGPATHIMLHVRGSSDPISPIVAICGKHSWRALDTVTGEGLDPLNPSRKGWDDFRAYRDQALK
jgi:hypothetical protein